MLHYPTRHGLIRERAKRPDFVGVSYVLSAFHRMKEVVALVRRHSPFSRIILGGYGTVLSDEESYQTPEIIDEELSALLELAPRRRCSRCLGVMFTEKKIGRF